MRENIKHFISQVFGNAVGFLLMVLAVAIFLASWLMNNSDLAIR